MPFKIIRNDITRVKADAIVNTANPEPRYASGTDAAIYKAAGADDLLAERKKIGRIAPGEVAVTAAFQLPAKYIIHTVGPIVQYKLTPKLEKDLEDCYRNTLDMCKENGLKSVAFCCISTGIFHFPNKRAAEIAVSTVEKWMHENPGFMERVIFNVFKDEDKEYYEEFIQ